MFRKKPGVDHPIASVDDLGAYDVAPGNFFHKNYTSVDPKQFTVSKFRLKPVILISEYFCSRCGYTNHPPPPHKGRQPETTGNKTTSEPKKAATPTTPHPPHKGRQPETMGDNGRQDHFRAQETDHTNQHQGGQISSCIKNPNSKLFGE